MKRALAWMSGAPLLVAAFAVSAGDFGDTIALFKNAGASAGFFHHSYGYAVFPTIGKGGFVVGGARSEEHTSELQSR